MPLRAFDTLFKISRIGPCRKHGGIVIAFKEYGVEGRYDIYKFLEYMPQIGQHAKPLCACLDHEGRPVRSVMRRAYGVHENIAEFEFIG